MIFASVVLSALLAAARAASSPAECQNTLLPLLGCADTLSADCAAGESLFDVLDPATVCVDTCKDTIVGAFETADSLSCCTYDTLYSFLETAGSTCTNSQYLSYNGFANAIEYFCSSAEVEGEDYYCFSDAQDYALTTTAVLQSLAAYPTFAEKQATFNAAVNCTQIRESQCCYPTLTTFAGACGDAAAQAKAANLALWEANIATACTNFQSVPLDFDVDVCNGLTTITTDECLAASDPACDGISPPSGDDDDAAATMLPAFGSVLAAMLGAAFFTRRF